MGVWADVIEEVLDIVLIPFRKLHEAFVHANKPKPIEP